MQRFLLQLCTLALVVSGLLFVGCGDDNPIIDNPLGPEISLVSGTGLLTADTELEPNVAFQVRLRVLPGDNPLQSISITRDGDDLDNTGVTYSIFSDNVGTITANSPFLLTGADVDGGTFDISINPDDVDGDFSDYTFTVTDTEGRTDATSIGITTIRLTTPLEGDLSGALLNQVGPTGTGGLDLDTGMGVGSNDPSADIQDEGIDTTIPAPGPENWRRQISAANNATMVAVDPAQLSENFSFDAVDNQEVIRQAYDTGTTLSGDDTVPSSDSVMGEEVTEPVEVGDLFAIERDGRYYLIRIDEVTPAAMSNNDKYTISIKY